MSGIPTPVGTIGPIDAYDVMSTRERAAVDYATTYYGVEAKAEAARFLGSLGLEETVAGVVLTAMAARINQADFVGKKEAADRFKDLQRLLGSSGVEGTSILHVIDANDGSEPIPPRMAELEPAREPDDSPVIKGKYRQDMLVRFFGEENRARIETVTENQGAKLAEKIGETILPLKVGSSVETKQARTLMLGKYLRGATTKELAAEFDVKENLVGVGLRQMAKGLNNKADPNQLQQIFDDIVR